jgi:E3 ubiquitin-protein ligase BRE1
LDQNEILINELQKMVKEKSKLLDEEKHLQDQIEEGYEKMKKKWDKISQGDNPAEQQLVEECEELRVNYILFFHAKIYREKKNDY